MDLFVQVLRVMQNQDVLAVIAYFPASDVIKLVINNDGTDDQYH